MTWYITTSPTGIEYGVKRVGHTKAYEMLSLEGLGHDVKTPEQARRAGFSRCRRATADEVALCEQALERHLWHVAWQQRDDEEQRASGWHEVSHEGKRWWARELVNGSCELVTPAGDARMVTWATLTRGRRVDDAIALAALRMSSVLSRVPAPAKPLTKQTPKPKPIADAKSAVELAQERLADLKRRGLIHRHASL